MDTPNNFRETSGLPISASSKRKPSPDKIEKTKLDRLIYDRWQGFVIRGIFVIVHIAIETCIEQVSAAISGSISAKDLEFYRKCEHDARAFASDLKEMTETCREPNDFGHGYSKLYILSINDWTHLFVNKMRSLNTESSLMAVTRIMHASKFYKKTPQELHESRETYVDADPTRPVKLCIPIMPAVGVLRGQILSYEKRSAQQNSSPSQNSSPPRMDAPKRSFADVLTGRNR